MRNRSDDVTARGVSHPGFLGSFRLGGQRKNRGQAPPVPGEAPGNGVPMTLEAGEPGAEKDYGRMANPLANGARRVREGFADAHRSYAQIQRHGDNGRRNEPTWIADQPAAPQPALSPQAAAEYRSRLTASYDGTARADQAASQRFNEELLSGPEPAESYDYRALRRAVDEATNPSYAPQQAPRGNAGTVQDSETWNADATNAYEAEEDMEGPRILVVDRSGDFSTELAEASVDLEPIPEILRLSRSTQVIEVVDQEEPDILVLAPQEMTGAGLKRVAAVHRAHPEIVVILSESDKDISANQIAATGALDLIPSDPTHEQLRGQIMQAVEAGRAETVEVEEEPLPEPDFLRESEPEPVPSFLQTPRRAASANTRLARVFTVASASGGCGKTFYSTNLAAYLAKATGGKVLLVDLDLQFGEVAISLHLRPKRTIAELVGEEDIPGALSEYVITHSGDFHVLCAPRDPIAGDKVGPRETTAVLEAAREAYDYVVVDTPPSINETVLAAFDQSQSLVLMATMDLPSLKNLRVFLETLKKLSLPADQISVIVNKAESGTGIDLKEVEPLYPQGFSAVLPYAKQVSWSINMGMPVLMADPDADISRKFVEGAIKLAKPVPGVNLPWATTATAPRRGWFSRLLKGTG